MNWKKVIDKGFQGGATAGLGGAIAYAATAMLIAALPELEVREGVVLAGLLLICTAAVNAGRNWLKHRERTCFGPPGSLIIIALLLPALLFMGGCTSLANLVTAEGIYANKNYIVEGHGTNFGIGFEQMTQGNLPMPKIGYWKTDFVFMAVPLDPDDALQYSNERDVTVGTEGGVDIYSGNRTTLGVDAQKYLKEIERDE